MDDLIRVLPTIDRCPADFAEFSSQKLYWYTTDSKENYKRNCHDHPRVMEFWEDKEVVYEFNKFGFRSPEFTKSDNNIVFLGCSHTTGIGLPVEETFPHIISKELGMNLCNLGIPGGSNDTCYRLANFWIPTIRPKLVVYKKVEQYRQELKMYGNHAVYWHGFHARKDNQKVAQSNFGDYWDQWASHEENSKFNAQKNIDAVEAICNRLGIKFYVMGESRYGRDRNRPDLVTLARDLQHPGQVENKDQAWETLNQLG